MINQMFKAFNNSYHEARKYKLSQWPYKCAESYIIFAWLHLRPELYNDWVYHHPLWKNWVPVAPPMTENHALFALGEKRPLKYKILRSNDWFERKVASDIRYYEYFSDSAQIETIEDGTLKRIWFSGKAVNSVKQNDQKGLLLRVFLSQKLYNKFYKSLFD